MGFIIEGPGTITDPPEYITGDANNDPFLILWGRYTHTAQSPQMAQCTQMAPQWHPRTPSGALLHTRSLILLKYANFGAQFWSSVCSIWEHFLLKAPTQNHIGFQSSFSLILCSILRGPTLSWIRYLSIGTHVRTFLKS